MEHAMNVQVNPRVMTAPRHLPFECVALVLQGGGALGAYQAGVYEALAEAGIEHDWVAGVSVGAINAAIIAGNPPNSRIDRLTKPAALRPKCSRPRKEPRGSSQAETAERAHNLWRLPGAAARSLNEITAIH
jgi:predicted acylesterase/phospholipase RssA